MALRQKVLHYFREELCSSHIHVRCYGSNVDWKRLKPFILKRINNRAKDYPVKGMTPVAYDVLEARKLLIQGVSTLLRTIPVKSCKCCPELFVGAEGHHIKTCHGYKRIKKDQEHKWVDANVSDILMPVEAFHLQSMFQPIVKHEQRFDFDRVPAVVELCSQAGAQVSDKFLHNNAEDQSQQFDSVNQSQVGQQTLEAWERLRLGVKKLLFVYPTKVCQHCSEVHIGPSGHKVRVCGIFPHEGFRGGHWWKKAELDDLVPQKVVWHQRPQDPEVLQDSGREFYGHAPAVVELCLQAGARIPKKYFCMMKLLGLAPRPVEQQK